MSAPLSRPEHIIREYGAWRMLADFAGMCAVFVTLAIAGVMAS